LGLAPQEIRTFFVSFAISERRFLLQSDRFCELLLDVIRDNRRKKRMEVHEFVFMPNHVHLLLTPAPDVPLEKAIQFIKGGFSFRAGRELNFRGEVWQKGFNEHRIQDAADYANHVEYMRMNPVNAGLVTRANEWPYSSARLTHEVDPAPPHLQKPSAKAPVLREHHVSPA
jgi:putative transposase